MTSASIAIVDTGSGNLRSVEKALAAVGGRPTITGDPDVIVRAERLVVPGQGAFGEFARAVKAQGLTDALLGFIATGRPFLGICLGLQVLYEESEEQGPVAGLGLLKGRVARFRPQDPSLKVPHMGWNEVSRPAGRASGHEDSMLRGIPDCTHVYFVHSYYVMPEDAGTVALECNYGVPFTAAIRKDNLFACQFHPEKSQAAGLRLLSNFITSP